MARCPDFEPGRPECDRLHGDPARLRESHSETGDDRENRDRFADGVHYLVAAEMAGNLFQLPGARGSRLHFRIRNDLSFRRCAPAQHEPFEFSNPEAISGTGIFLNADYLSPIALLLMSEHK